MLKQANAFRKGVFDPALRFMQACVLAAFICILSIFTFGGCGRGPEGPSRHIQRLSHPSESVRSRAVDALGRIPDEAAPLLREAYLSAGSDEEGERVVSGAAEVLRNIKTRENLQTVAHRFDSATEQNPAIRLVAIRTVAALSVVQRRMATEYLKTAVDDPDMRCVQAALRGLFDMQFIEAVSALEEVFRRREGEAYIISARYLYEYDRREDAADSLIEGLFSDDEDIRNRSVNNIVELGTSENTGAEMLSLLIEFSREYPEKEAVREVVTSIRDVLLARIEGVLPPLRIQRFMSQLAMIADSEVLSVLSRIIMSTDESVFKRSSAAEALGRAVGSEGRPMSEEELLLRRTRELLHDILDDARMAGRIQIAAAISLSLMQEEKGITFLLSQLDELDAEVDRTELIALRISVQEAMEASGDFVVPFLIKALQDPRAGDITRWASAYTLGRLEDRSSVPILAGLITSTVGISELEGPADAAAVEVDTANGKVVVPVNRQAIVKSAFGSGTAVPKYGPGIRIAAAKGLGRVACDMSLEALRESRQLHKNQRDILDAYLFNRGYSELMPPGILDEEDRIELRDRLQAIVQEIIVEYESMLFYILRSLASDDSMAE